MIEHPRKSVFVALIAVWTALVLSVVFIPGFPVLGTSAQVSISSVLFSGLTAPLLGYLGGTVSGLISGLAGPILNPAISLGPLTFLGPTIGALVSGLFLFNRWKEAVLIFAAGLIIWFAHPFAWYQLMPIVTWQYWLALILIVIPPIRKRIINSIFSGDPKTLTIALWCLAWIARMGDVLAASNNSIWVLEWTGAGFYPFWAPLTLYYAIADSLTALGGAIIATTILLALKRNGITIAAIDFFKPTSEAK